MKKSQKTFSGLIWRYRIGSENISCTGGLRNISRKSRPVSWVASGPWTCENRIETVLKEQCKLSNDSNKVRLKFIAPGRSTQNAYIESFNVKFRDECLNEHVFVNLHNAQQIIETWRKDYIATRPHKSLKNMTPEEFSAEFFRNQQTEITNHEEVQ